VKIVVFTGLIRDPKFVPKLEFQVSQVSGAGCHDKCREPSAKDIDCMV
jgi:hypothetical protein